jgi:hypothetical protein
VSVRTMRINGLLLAVAVMVACMGCEPGDVTSGPSQTVAILAELPETQVLHISIRSGEPTVHGEVDGRPRVSMPHGIQQVVIPFGYRFESLDVTAGLDVPIAGALAWIKEEGDASPDVVSRSALDCVKVFGTQPRRGADLLVLDVIPIAETQDRVVTAYYEDLELHITVRKDPAKAGYTVRYRPDPYRPLEHSVLNPETLATYDAKIGVPRALGGLCNDEETHDYDYVIIGHRALLDDRQDVTMDDFIERKESQGHSVKLVTMDQITASYPGRDDPEKMRNFLTDAYNRWDTDFVLLAGEPGHVPTRAMYMMSGVGPLIFIASDMYFQCLDGTMNSNDDDHWGERTDGPNGTDIDMFAELYVGRVPATSPEHIANWVRKTLKYEDLETDPSRQRALLIGEWTGFTEEFAFAKDAIEEIRTGADIHGVKTRGFSANPNIWTDTLYDQDCEWSYKELLELLNDGEYSVINHLGHGYPKSVMKLKIDEVDELTNDKPFVIYSQACYAGAMFDDSIAERFLTAPNGAAAVVMNSHMGHGASSTNGPSQRVNRAFWEAFFAERVPQIGVMNAYAHEYAIYRADVSAFRLLIIASNLFGDPTLEVLPLDETWDDE